MTEKIVYWIPRVLAILAILFLMMFSLDVFEGDASLGKKLVGFLIHNIPAFIIIAVLVIAWKWELYGGLLFILVALAACIRFNSFTTNRGSLVIFLPFILTGALFILHHYMYRKSKE